MGLTTAEVAQGLRAKKKANTRNTLQETALRLFKEKGFSRVSVDEIAMEAEVSRSTFFRYFGSKEAVLMREMDETGETFLQHLAERPPDEAPLKAFEEAILAASQDAAARDVQEQQLIVDELLRNDPALSGRRLAEQQRWTGLIAHAFAARGGRAEPNLDDQLASSIGLAILEEVGRVVQQDGGASNVNALIAEAFAAVRRL